MVQQPQLAQVPATAQSIIRVLDGISIFAGKACSWLLIPMVLSLVYEVVMRYFVHAPTIWAMDVAVIMYGINFMIGSPFTLQAGEHIRMDFIYNRWSTRTKAVVDILMYLVLFFPVHIVFLQIGWSYFYKSFQQNEHIVSSPWMPIIWPLKFAIPLSIVLLLLQGISEVMKCYYRIKTGENLWGKEEEIKPVEEEPAV